MEVIILAGGLGTRLRSVVSEVPKCMAPVAGRPFLWYLLQYLKCYDVTKVILSVGYLRDVVQNWIAEIKDDFPFTFEYAVEEEPLGTGGGIKLALGHAVEDRVVVLNGDTFFNVDLEGLFRRKSVRPITLALKPMRNFERYGNVKLDNNGVVESFEEKKHCAEGLINGGVYLIDRRFDIMPPDKDKFSFENDVLASLCKNRCLDGIVDDGYFIDIGVPEDYARANEEFESFDTLLKR